MTKRILLAVMCTLLVLVIVMSCIVFHRISSLFSGLQLSAPPGENTGTSQTNSTQTSTDGTTQTTEGSRPADPPHEHEYVKTSSVKPTCDAFGYTVYTCSTCGKTDLPEEEFQQPYGHDYELEETVTRTCTTDGYTAYVCKTCGDTDKRDVVKAEGHTLGVGKVTKPTCTEDGYTTYTCSVCQDDTVDNLVEALGHEYGEWSVEIDAGDAVPGIQQRTCIVCEDVDTEIIPPTGDLEITNGDGHGVVTSKYDSDNKLYRHYEIVVGTEKTPTAYTYTIDYHVTGGVLTYVYGDTGLVITYEDANGDTQTKTLPPYMDTNLVISAEEDLPGGGDDPVDTPDSTDGADTSLPDESTGPAGTSESTQTTASDD